jgi:4-hydroxybenzoate polyprenyltransferase
MKLRLVEAIPFFGVSLLGSLMADWPRPIADVLAVWLSAGGAFFLLWFAFLFNNWQDQPAEIQNTARGKRLAFSPQTNRLLVMVAAAASVGLYAATGKVGLWLSALAVLALAFFYSWRRFPAKQLPFLGTLLHFLVAGLVFTAGWMAAGDFSRRGVLAGLFPGLLFAAGHLHHEALDFEKDRRSGVLTQAVRYGPARVVQAGRVLWLFSPLPILWLSWVEKTFPESLGWLAAALTAGYLIASFQLLRNGVFAEALAKLRRFYRTLYLLGGFVMLVLLEPERLLWF